MDHTSIILFIILLLLIAVVITIAICKSVFARKAGAIMRRMCVCSSDEREMFGKVLAHNSNGFGTDIFHLFDS